MTVPRSRRPGKCVLLGLVTLLLLGCAPSRTAGPTTPPISAAAANTSVHLPLAARNLNHYIDTLSAATYSSILAMVEPATGLPHDRIDASLLDIVPQFAVARIMPYTGAAASATLVASRCTAPACRYSGTYGLELDYVTPSQNTWASLSFDSPGFDVSRAVYLEAWVKGAQGGERFEFVLWSDLSTWPGRPQNAEITATPSWQRVRIPLADFPPYAQAATALRRLSIGFNDAMSPGGTVYLDQIAFVDADGARVPAPMDEDTSVSNIGLYIASVLGARRLGLETDASATTRLQPTITSLEKLSKWHGFPQTHNRAVSLQPSDGDRCIAAVDMGNLAAGLIVLRQAGLSNLSGRAGVLVDAMEWDWLYDTTRGLYYGCRYADGSASSWHYDWLAADSRLAYAIGIRSGKLPADAWDQLRREPEPPRCLPAERWHFAPGWQGGGLFMMLLPQVFLDERDTELYTSTLNLIDDQICLAEQIGSPAWGWSATALAPYGAEYCGYGCLRDDILVPHASILAAEYIAPTRLVANLEALERLGARPLAHDGLAAHDLSFPASVNWQSGEVCTVYLVLDQDMAFLALVNAQTGGYLGALFAP